jgi:hypothetical protein
MGVFVASGIEMVGLGRVRFAATADEARHWQAWRGRLPQILGGIAS